MRAIVLAFLLPSALFAEAPTFFRDVVPILQKHCQSCHRPGEIGPMPLLTYEQVRPWAKAIREAVALRKMPPWFAAEAHPLFSNDPSLTAREVDTLGKWAESGASKGVSADAPVAVNWPSGWSLQKPDAVLAMPTPLVVKGGSTLDYQYIVIPTGFTEDRWVQAIEVRPSERSLVHHAVVYVREPGEDWMRAARPGVPFAPSRPEQEEGFSDILAIYTPGSPSIQLPAGMARKVAAGSDLILQMHYTSAKKDLADQTRIGLVFAKEPPRQRVITLQMGNYHFVIPPEEKDCKVSASGTMPRDALLLDLFPHMHLRGKSFEYLAQYPDGRFETLLQVKPYDFYWQLTYRLANPILLRKGTRLIFTAHFDNSANNPRNPDPQSEVTVGQQSWQEMMIGFFNVAVEPSVDKRSFLLQK